MSKFTEATAKAHALQEALRAEGYDDLDVLASIESETDLLRVFDRVAERVDQDNRSAVIARERARRLEARADKNAEFLGYLMGVLGTDKVERPTATVWWQDNPGRLEVEEDKLGQYWLTAKPDADRIKKALKAGEAIPGATLIQGRTLKVKSS